MSDPVSAQCGSEAPPESLLESSSAPHQSNPKVRRWALKEVTVKTLNGEFSASVWQTDEELPERCVSPSSKSKRVGKAKKSNVSIACTFEGCTKTFRDSYQLKKHTVTHNPKTHVCSECGKAFNESSKLKRHNIVHTGAKPYQCTYEGCFKKFSLDFNLRTHMKTHCGDKPHT